MWKEYIANKFADILNSKARVLEIGAALGNFRGILQVKEHLTLDVLPGSDINIVSIAHKYKAPAGSFDAVCSTSELEHDMYWKKTLKKMVELTRSGGLIFFSCCKNWEEHGTLNTSPEQSMASQLNEKWGNYYRNITPEDVQKVWDLDRIFSTYEIGVSQFHDGFTVFWGIKR